MSVWTQVDGFVTSKAKISKTLLEEAFGKEMCIDDLPDKSDYMSLDENGEFIFDDEAYEKEYAEVEKHNSAEWEEYLANKDSYMPCGSEGTLGYDPMTKVGDYYEYFQYGISGALRDYDNENAIIKWFQHGYFTLSQKLFPDNPWAIHAKISASSGVGELTWEINNPEWFKV